MGRFLRRLRDGLLVVTILLVGGLVAVRLSGDGADRIIGRARVIDGDTVQIGPERIRLAGIDAPELAQTCQREGQDWSCGRQARAALIALVAPGGISCEIGGSDRYRRLLGICSLGEADINGVMVSTGMAVSFGSYQNEEAVARSGKLGLWAGTFDQPRDWRRVHGGLDEGLHLPDVIWHWLSWLRWPRGELAHGE